MLQTGIKWLQELLCYLTGTKWTLVPAQNQPVLIERGRIALFLVVHVRDKSVRNLLNFFPQPTHMIL